VTDTGVAEAVVCVLLLGLALLLGYDNSRTGVGWDSTGPQAGYFRLIVRSYRCARILVTARAQRRKQTTGALITTRMFGMFDLLTYPAPPMRFSMHPFTARRTTGGARSTQPRRHSLNRRRPLQAMAFAGVFTN
jgi:hypothetical protein